MGRIVPVVQGSAEWEDLRRSFRPASLTAVVLGFKKGESRQSLVRLMASGSEKDFSDFLKTVIFERGHTAERNGRPNAEEIIGEELSPLTYVDDETRLLASLDGINEGETVSWECKLENSDLIQIVNSGILPDTHWPQVEQGLFCSGASRCLFTVCDVDGNILAKLWYEAVPGRIEKIIAAWEQFEHDVANYQHVEIAAKTTARPVLDLPAVSVSVSGQISVIDNFARFGDALKDFVENQLVKDPQTDQDFADLEAQIKTLKKAEEALDAGEKAALSQVKSIETMQRMKAMLHKLAREHRIASEKAVKDQKEKVRLNILNAAVEQIKELVAVKNKFLGANYIAMPAMKVEERMKGKKTIQALHDAAADAVAEAAVEMINQVADRVEANLAYLKKNASESRHLFPDIVTIAAKQEDDFCALVAMRLSAEQSRLDKVKAEAKAQAEAEAKARAESEARARIEAEAKAAAEREEKAKADAAAKAAADQDARKDRTEESASMTGLSALSNEPRSCSIEAIANLGVPFKMAERIVRAIENGEVPHIYYAGGKE